MTTTPSPELPDLDRIANDLESEAIPYEGDFADAVRAAIEDIREVAAARRAQPEGEAPQAEPVAWMDPTAGCAMDAFLWQPHPGYSVPVYAHTPAAQHAESGAPAMEADLLARDLDAAALAQDDKHLHGLLVRASVGIKALAAQSQGARLYTQDEAERLARHTRDAALERAQQAAPPGALESKYAKALRNLLLDVECGVLDGDARREARDLLDSEDEAAPSAPGTPEAPAWRKITGPGQVEVGARLRFNIGDKQFSERAKLILNAGTEHEEVIYDKGRNFYFITSCVMSGFSNHKNVEFMPPKRAAQLDGGQEGSESNG